ncbi:2-C-methyl-D-erythritol 4-phosphate cytidylyltransferase [Ahniella affigens]|uniref:2-C-methyl-D-erythritol 4-phosphate cytidylyltransferase n=1 Tax=Ahniella affigens TaxID=2021234 RepID=A0A2P1PYB5_9GAMM|nr:2-C-methyl-D-erythritol 4-phosphate cytidylyltransferase [Ahniella affigens]AVP99814.1 2-C-methyl-D-erythritol 4-phosphate cytidylyltransferase [Ahniella affigens]
MKAATTALIAAAGVGSRLGLGPKAFLRLGAQSLLARVAHTATAVADTIVAAIPPGSDAEARAELPGHVRLIHGGESRQQSFAQLLAEAHSEYVLLLDIARPLVSADLCQRVLNAAARHGAAGAYVPALVPAARVDAEGGVVQAYAADQYHLPQMPQAFRRTILIDVLARAKAQGLQRQTVWQLAVELGVRLQAVRGEPGNIKITEPVDWALAQCLIDAPTSISRSDV